MNKLYPKSFTGPKNAGFTLIELLVVVLIIGILSAVALPQYEKAVAKARFSRFLPLMRTISDAQRVYYMSNGEYAADLRNLDVDMPAGAKTDGGSYMVYDNFTCQLQGGTPISLYCYDAKYEAPWLEKYFASDDYLCWAYASAIGKSVCQNLSGKSTPDGDNGLYRF